MASVLFSLAACTPVRQAAPSLGLGTETRLEPALSGDGRLLASLLVRDGRTTVVLQERQTGRLLALAHLQRNQPHHSPSLSWNGRYLALISQQGERRLAVIEDRATGQLHPLPLPPGQEVQRLSLAPDASRLAMEVSRGGLSRVLIFDLRPRLEPDLPPGQSVSGGGLP
jgi:Tol biopolymer transport system component